MVARHPPRVYSLCGHAGTSFVSEVQRIVEALRARRANLVVLQHASSHSADDCGLWFVDDEATSRTICQFESPHGAPPFLVEGGEHDGRWVAISVDEVVEMIDAIARGEHAAILEQTRVRPVDSPERALAWLASRGAHPWLVRHHELVLEAARELLDAVEARFDVTPDRAFVLIGAAVHDVGKMIVPSEMSAPGHAHEEAGAAFLAYAGFGASSRVATSHASWDAPGTELSDRLVALADKLWKGKREPLLEEAVIDEVASLTQRERWDVYARLDSIFEQVAEAGPERLARSVV